MFHSPPVSPRGSFADHRSIVSGTAAPSQPRYFRDPQGKLKYAIEVDLNGFPEENIRVTNVRNIITIDAKFVDLDVSGDERTHELRRELYLPANVNASTVTCVLSADGILVIEADATEQIPRPLSPPNSAQMNRLSTANYLASPARFTNPPPSVPPHFDRNSFYGYGVDPRRITFHEPGSGSSHVTSARRGSISHFPSQPTFFGKPPPTSRVSFAKPLAESILKSSPSRRGGKNVRLVAPTSTVNQSSSAGNLQTTWKRGLSVSPERPARQNLHYPYGSAPKMNQPNSAYGQKRYTLRVDVGPKIRPEDLSVSVQNGVVVINAKRFMRNRNAPSGAHEQNRIIYEHHSEHTLPVCVNPVDLTCRLDDDGIVSIDAPYSFGGTSTPVPLPTDAQKKTNSAASRKFLSTSRASPFPLLRTKDTRPSNHV